MSKIRKKFCLRIAGNTHNPALLALKAKGYELFLGFFPEEDEKSPWYPEMPCWEAYKEGRLFSATTPVELLGLVALWETRGDNWRTEKHELRLYQEFMAKPKALKNKSKKFL